jgi:hypothetical protein
MGVVRLFLAFVVVTDHWRLQALDPRRIGLTSYAELRFNAGYAVMFFYVISGFLITYTLVCNYPPDALGIRRFYWNRLVRIFSVYWPVVLLAFVTVTGAWTGFVAAGFADKLISLFLLGMGIGAWRSPHIPPTIGAQPSPARIRPGPSAPSSPFIYWLRCSCAHGCGGGNLCRLRSNALRYDLGRDLPRYNLELLLHRLDHMFFHDGTLGLRRGEPLAPACRPKGRLDTAGGQRARHVPGAGQRI